MSQSLGEMIGAVDGSAGPSVVSIGRDGGAPASSSPPGAC